MAGPAGGNLASRDSYTANWYDLAGRLTDTADVGTNGSVSYTYPNVPPGRTTVSSQATSTGSSTTLVDTTLTGATGSYVGYQINIIAGTDSGFIGAITGYNATTHTLTFTPGTSGGTATNSSSQYTLTPTALLTHTDYNAAGEVQDTIDPRGIVTVLTYDLLGRQTQEIDDYTNGTPTASTNQTTDYAYDGNGDIVTQTAVLPASAMQQTEYVYGVGSSGTIYSNDLLARTEYPLPSGTGTGYADTTNSYDWQSNGYDYQGEKTSYGSLSGTGTVVNQVEDVYNGLEQLTVQYQAASGSVNTSSTPSVQYNYTQMSGGENNSRLRSIVYPDGRILDYDYSPSQEPITGITHSGTTATATTAVAHGLSMSTPVTLSASHSYYLVSSETSGGDKWYNSSTAVSPASGAPFTINGWATNTGSWSTGGTSNHSYGLLDLQYMQSTSRTTNSQNELTAVGSATPVYDHDGNMTTDPNGMTYTYDAWNRMVNVGGGAEVFGYLPGSERASRTYCGVSTTDSYYSTDWQVLEEDIAGACSGSNVQSQYVWGLAYIDQLVERDDGSTSGSLDVSGSGLGKRIYVQQDANWNVTAITDTSGNVLERFVYDPYGNRTVLSASWTPASDSYTWLYGFQGGRLDPVSGLINFRNRDYSPTLGAWMEQDPTGYSDSLNLYLIDDSDPVSRYDPFGTRPISRVNASVAEFREDPET